MWALGKLTENFLVAKFLFIGALKLHLEKFRPKIETFSI